MLYFLDEPTADPAALNTLLISEFAIDKGIKVLLSGSGGDDIFTGYRRHFAIQQEKWWAFMPKPLRSLLSRSTSKLNTKNPFFRRISKAFSYAHLDDDQRIVSYFLWNKPETVISLFTDDLRNELETEDVFSPLLETLSRISPTTSPLNKMLYLECKHFLADHNLNYADKMGMATGLEIRVPLLDLELVNFVTRIPLKFKQKFSQGKWIFKKTMEKYLPHEVIYRSKTGFGGPLKFWMNGILKETCDDVFSKESIDSRGIFDYKEIKNLIKLDSSGKVDATYSIFSILCLELWFRQYIDGDYAVDNILEEL